MQQHLCATYLTSNTVMHYTRTIVLLKAPSSEGADNCVNTTGDYHNVLRKKYSTLVYLLHV